MAIRDTWAIRLLGLLEQLKLPGLLKLSRIIGVISAIWAAIGPLTDIMTLIMLIAPTALIILIAPTLTTPITLIVIRTLRII
jgi:hypothetical protein